MIARSVLALIAPVLLAVACRQAEHAHEATAHDHAEKELPARSVTSWTAKAELFMEYDPLVVGKESRFAAHLTTLDTFKPVDEGAATLVVTMEDGSKASFTAEKPASPGIFRALIRPAKTGKCTLSVVVRGAGLSDQIDAGACLVYPDLAAATAGAPEEGGAKRIVFTKEQQWRTEFATAPVVERELQPSVQANAEIRPVAGKEARLTAAATGRVSLATPVPVLGMAVKAGQILATISPRLAAGGDRASLDAELLAGQAELDAAQVQVARAERLFQEQAVPARSVEEAKTRLRLAQARRAAAQGRLDQYAAGAAGARAGGKNTFQVRSPIAGTLVATKVASGESIEEGRLLFTVIDLSKVWLEARVFEADIPKVEGARSAWFTIDGYDAPFVVDDQNGKLVTVGKVVDPMNRTVPVIFEVANPSGRLRIGQFAKVAIATGASQKGLAVPAAAVLEDGGRTVVYVQSGGEAFERRPVTVGVRSPGWVGVREGLAAGERVVTAGAYEVKLTAASGVIPQHGHVH